MLPNVSTGNHTVGIKAIYKNASSPTTEYNINVTGVQQVTATAPSQEPASYYNVLGQEIPNIDSYHGIAIKKQGNNVTKIMR